jgi:hypothetical protein
MKSDTICYTGMGARNDGDHTQEQFLNIMNDTKEYKFKDECPPFIKSTKCKPCKIYKSKINKYFKQQMKKAKKEQKPGESPKLVLKKTFIKEQNACKKCKTSNINPCSLSEYIKYSGAEPGSCKNLRGGRFRRSGSRSSRKRRKSKKYLD